jgi:hypothetical protein
MADWPDAEELKQVLDITSEDWDDTVDRVLAAAIAQVKLDVGRWDEYEDEPDEKLAQAALRMGELISSRPTEPTSDLGADPAYRSLIKGHRRVFGIA